MKFSAQLVRHYLRLSPQVFHYWLKRLPPLADQVKHLDFLHGEFLALAVIENCVRENGISLRVLGKYSESLFKLLHDVYWRHLPANCLMFNTHTHTVDYFTDFPLVEEPLNSLTIVNLRTIANNLCMYVDFDPKSKWLNEQNIPGLTTTPNKSVVLVHSICSSNVSIAINHFSVEEFNDLDSQLDSAFDKYFAEIAPH